MAVAVGMGGGVWRLVRGSVGGCGGGAPSAGGYVGSGGGEGERDGVGG